MLLALFAALAPLVQAPSPASPTDTTVMHKTARAVRLTGAPPRIDGRLDESVWQQAVFFDDFIQKDPVEGATPTVRTEVGILYDDDAIYVAARLYGDGSRIQRNVARRDVGGGQSEHIWVSFDSYRDRRTAYSFGVTASGVRMDWYHPRDHEFDLVSSFDPVWEADATVEGSDWFAEMRIPFSQLRFRDEDVQVWGFNVDRWIPSRNEDLFWIPVPRNVTAWSSRMGDLVGIQGVRPKRRVELLPYAASNATLRSDADAADPFDSDGRSASLRVGGDLKVGLGPNITAEATINPDFGQVDADPAVVNLSQFETAFDERRPFFVEGANLLRGSGATWFYSRRIGAPPPGPAAGDFVDRPDATTILSAAKITGRMSGGLSVAGLAAVTARETARTFDSAGAGTFGEPVVAPLTGFGVARVQQEFGRYRSTIGAILTGVRRDLDTATGLHTFLNRQAVTGGIDWNLRFARGFFELSGWLGGSHISGDSQAIAVQQRSSRRYYQRPDQDYVSLDPSRTTLTGYSAGLGIAKISGRHWLWNLSGTLESPGFEVNDGGRIVTADGQSLNGTLTYRETRPGRLFRGYSVSHNMFAEFNYGGDRQFSYNRFDVSATLLNQWQVNLSGWVDHRAQDERLTRGGPSMAIPRTTVGIVQVLNNFAAETRWNARVFYGQSELGDRTYRLSGGLTVRPGPRWLLQATPNYLFSENSRQYIRTLATANAPAATYGARYIFARVVQTQWSVQFRFNYAFAPDLTLEVYAEPFIASGAFSRHGELPAARALRLREYGVASGTTAAPDGNGGVDVVADGDAFNIGPRDFNVSSLRSNTVLRWEWRPGSTLYLVWSQNRGGETGDGRRVRVDDLFRGFEADGDNFLALKVSYWISAN